VLAGGLFVAWLVALEPMASGSGIPQVEGVVLFRPKDEMAYDFGSTFSRWHLV